MEWICNGSFLAPSADKQTRNYDIECCIYIYIFKVKYFRNLSKYNVLLMHYRLLMLNCYLFIYLLFVHRCISVYLYT